ncbi:MAG: hypothetical protein IJS53_04250 [Clostridia bacterium]|nr:hypothetical protein [Clostridia bacterium]
MPEKNPSSAYKLVKALVRLFYGKMEVVGAENLPDGPFAAVGNHAQLHGPIACELFFPRPRKTWCIGQMMHLREVPGYAFQDFWSKKPRWQHGFWHLVSYAIAPLSVLVFNNAETIPVYHDGRLMSTFRQTLQVFRQGDGVVIFPERDAPHNNIVYDFQDRFVDVGRMYYNQSKQALPFVPIYVAPALRKLVIGRPVWYDPAADSADERRRVTDALMDAVTEMGRALPRHRVVPYPNLPKREYPWSDSAERP